MNRRVTSLFGWLKSYPLTSVGLILLVCIPGGLLTSFRLVQNRVSEIDPPVQRELLQISDSLSLLQSFRVDADASPPSLWSARLGADLAQRLWDHLDGVIWWQGWPQDGAPVLILPDWRRRSGDVLSLSPEAEALSQRLNDVVMLFADALNHQMFKQSFRPSDVTPPTIERFCLKQLRTTTAVFWTPDALSSISGALQPLLDSASHGCVALDLSGRSLTWSGVVSSRPLRSASNRLQPPSRIKLDRLFAEPPEPAEVASRPLLVLMGRTASTLFGSLLRRPLIREGLEDTYGLSTTLIQELLDAPLSLLLQPSRSGPFQASLQLDLQVSAMTPSLFKALESTSERLEQSNLQSRDQGPVHAKGASGTASRVWFEKDKEGQQRVLGGWRVMPPDPSGEEPTLLRFSVAAAPSGDRKASPDLVKVGLLQASLQPSKLSELGLLSDGWPSPVRRARRLDLVVRSLKGAATSSEEWRWMDGQLSLP